VIDFVSDWGAMFSAWLSLFEKTNADAEELIRSGQRHWIGIANDVLQLFVPDPPEGTYSMVRHHALMLVAATVWLGPESTRRWQAAHSIAAQRFLSGVSEDLQTAINAAERGLAGLLDDPRAHEEAAAVVAWLDSDAAARTAYQRYLGAASLGIAALLESVPLWTPDILTNLILQEHQDPDFNREEIECFAMLAVRSE
jgi:hypothetical protein